MSKYPRAAAAEIEDMSKGRQFSALEPKGLPEVNHEASSKLNGLSGAAFDRAAQLVQNRAERCAPSNHFEDMLFRGQQGFGQLAFRHVHHSSDVFNQFTRIIQHGVAEDMNISHLSAREDDSMVHFKIASLANCSVEGLVERRGIFRVNPLARGGVFAFRCLGIEPIDAIMLPGPKKILLSLYIPGPTSGMAQSLPF